MAIYIFKAFYHYKVFGSSDDSPVWD